METREHYEQLTLIKLASRDLRLDGAAFYYFLWAGANMNCDRKFFGQAAKGGCVLAIN